MVKLNLLTELLEAHDDFCREAVRLERCGDRFAAESARASARACARAARTIAEGVPS